MHYLWAYAPDPATVRAATVTAERMLEADPFTAGGHQSEGLWHRDVPPLILHYEIDPDERVVKITGVKTTE